MNNRYKTLVNRAALVATTFAFVFLIAKIYAWWTTSSVSMLASLVDSLVDIAASTTNLLIIRYSLKPADDDHGFGHGKAESLGALAQSMFILGSAAFLFLMGIERLVKNQPMQNTSIGITITIITFIATLLLVIFQRIIIKKTGSQAIKADMLHYQSDVMMNGAILIALILSSYGFSLADAIFAILIAIYILISSMRMAYDAIQSLLDRALPEKELREIQQTVKSIAGIIDMHDLKTRRSGETRFIQLHAELDDTLSFPEAHTISEQIETSLLTLFPHSDVIVHIDPINKDKKQA